ncbi:MAG: UxaA family hydrolase [Bauldia sp.]|nr:UxaA family hydrolase [Bauldia sp.]
MTEDDPRLLLLDPRDNVLIARARIRGGETIAVSGQRVTVPEDLPLGHKLARTDIGAGTKVIKYGAPIGSATTAIRTGEHAHVHNVKSDYTPTYHLDDERTRYGKAS